MQVLATGRRRLLDYEAAVALGARTMPTLRRHVVRFVILFPGRSGSTYVVSALDAHPAITAKGEVLDPLRPKGPEAQLDWTRRYLRGPAVNRSKAVGFKTKLRDVLDQAGFTSVLDEYDARLVYLDRRNDVKHTISRITARRLKDTTGRWNRYDGDARLAAFAVDFDDFQTRLDDVEAEKATIAEYVGQVDRPLLHLDYEDLLADPDATFHQLLAFLGLPPAPLEAARDAEEHQRRPARRRHQLHGAARPVRRDPVRAHVRRGARSLGNPGEMPGCRRVWALVRGARRRRQGMQTPTSDSSLTDSGIEAASRLAAELREGLGRVLRGKPEPVRLAVVTLLSGGHLLLDDVPGVGKTLLAKALARAAGGSFRRVQATPDLLPSELTGVSVFHLAGNEWEFRPGPLFANVVLVDELNRATPRTQSALLEAMEEHQVTVDGVTRPLPRPVLPHRHAEPVRDRGHVPARRGSARPLHARHRDRPARRHDRARAAARYRRRVRARCARAAHRPDRAHRRDRRGALGVLRAGGRRLRGRDLQRDARARRDRDRREPACVARAAARRAGPRRARRAAPTSSPTTSRGSRSRCSRTGWCCATPAACRTSGRSCRRVSTRCPRRAPDPRPPACRVRSSSRRRRSSSSSSGSHSSSSPAPPAPAGTSCCSARVIAVVITGSLLPALVLSRVTVAADAPADATVGRPLPDRARPCAATHVKRPGPHVRLRLGARRRPDERARSSSRPPAGASSPRPGRGRHRRPARARPVASPDPRRRCPTPVDVAPRREPTRCPIVARRHPDTRPTSPTSRAGGTELTRGRARVPRRRPDPLGALARDGRAPAR